MSSFTPGEWKYHDNDTSFIITHEDEVDEVVACLLNETLGKEAAYANARLIAAAPEMYEKLRDYAEVLEELSKMKDEENSKDDCLVCSNWAVVRIGEVISLINRIEKGNEANG